MVTFTGTNNSYIDEIIGFSIIIIIFIIFSQLIDVNFDLWLLGIIILVGMILGGILSAIVANLLQLEIFEIDYPEDTKEIDLSNRSITSIDLSGLRELTNLKVLNLENNMVERIDFAPFRKHPSLINLDVSSNKLEVVDLTVLKTCKNLQRLDLRDNSIESLEASDLLKLSDFSSLYIDENTKLTVDGVEVTSEQFQEMIEKGLTDVDQFLEAK